MLEREILDVLEEILIWTKASSFRSVKGVVEEVFSESRPEERLAYELLDGRITQGEIVNKCKSIVGPDCKISAPTLSIWITKWEKMGLAKKKEGKNFRCFSLVDFGIDVPQEKSGGKQSHEPTK